MSATATVIDEALELRVYNNYRAAVTSFSRYSEARAAEKRQYARKVTVERYNVPFAEVKRIVAKYDAINGVTHEHTEDYLRNLDLMVERDKFNQNPTACPSCDGTEKVTVRWEPFARVMKHEYNPMVSCYKCYFVNGMEAQNTAREQGLDPQRIW
jgi:hypothetical protein